MIDFSRLLSKVEILSAAARYDASCALRATDMHKPMAIRITGWPLVCEGKAHGWRR
jgi:predicted DNA-binding helix-hairpin-helix protein